MAASCSSPKSSKLPKEDLGYSETAGDDVTAHTPSPRGADQHQEEVVKIEGNEPVTNAKHSPEQEYHALTLSANQPPRTSYLQGEGFEIRSAPASVLKLPLLLTENSEGIKGGSADSTPRDLVAESCSSSSPDTPHPQDPDKSSATKYSMSFDILHHDEVGKRTRDSIEFHFNRNEAEILERYLVLDRNVTAQQLSEIRAVARPLEVTIDSKYRFTLGRMPKLRELRPCFAAIAIAHAELRDKTLHNYGENIRLLNELEEKDKETRAQKVMIAKLTENSNSLNALFTEAENAVVNQESAKDQLQRRYNNLSAKYEQGNRERRELETVLQQNLANEKVAQLELNLANEQKMNTTLSQGMASLQARLENLEQLESNPDDIAQFTRPPYVEDLEGLSSCGDSDVMRLYHQSRSREEDLLRQKNQLLRTQFEIQGLIGDALSHQVAARGEFEKAVATMWDKLGATTLLDERSVSGKSTTNFGEADTSKTGLSSEAEALSLNSHELSDLNSQRLIPRRPVINNKHNDLRKSISIPRQRKARPKNIQTQRHADFRKAYRTSFTTHETESGLPLSGDPTDSIFQEANGLSASSHLSPTVMAQMDELYQLSSLQDTLLEYEDNAELLCDFHGHSSMGHEYTFHKGDNVRVHVMNQDWWPVVPQHKSDQKELCLVPRSYLALTCAHFQRFDGYYQALGNYSAQNAGEMSVFYNEIVQVAHAVSFENIETIFWCSKNTSGNVRARGLVPESYLEKLSAPNNVPKSKFCPCKDGKPYTGRAKVLTTYIAQKDGYFLEAGAVVNVAHTDNSGLLVCVEDTHSGRQGFVPLIHLKIDQQQYLAQSEPWLPLTPNVLKYQFPASPSQPIEEARPSRWSISSNAKEWYQYQLPDINPVHRPWCLFENHDHRKRNPWEEGIPDHGPCYIERRMVEYLPRPLRDTLTFNSRKPTAGRYRARAKSLSSLSYEQEIDSDVKSTTESEPDYRHAPTIRRKYIYNKADNGDWQCCTVAEDAQRAQLESSLWVSHHRWSAGHTFKDSRIQANPYDFATREFPWGTHHASMSVKWPRPYVKIDQYGRQLRDDLVEMLEGDHSYSQPWNWKYRKAGRSLLFPVPHLNARFWNSYLDTHRKIKENYPLNSTRKCDVYAGHFVKVVEPENAHGFVKVQRPADLKVLSIPADHLTPQANARKIYNDWVEWPYDMFLEATTKSWKLATDDLAATNGDVFKVIYISPWTLDDDNAEIFVQSFWNAGTQAFARAGKFGVLNIQCLNPTTRLCTARLNRSIQPLKDDQSYGSIWPTATKVVVACAAENDNLNCFNGYIGQRVPSYAISELPPSEWIDLKDFLNDTVDPDTQPDPIKIVEILGDGDKSPVDQAMVGEAWSDSGDDQYLGLHDYDWIFPVIDDENHKRLTRYCTRIHEIPSTNDGRLWCMAGMRSPPIAIEFSVLDLDNPCLPVYRLSNFGSSRVVTTEDRNQDGSQTHSVQDMVIVLARNSRRKEALCLAYGNVLHWLDTSELDEVQSISIISVQQLIERGAFIHDWQKVKIAVWRLFEQDHNNTNLVDASLTQVSHDEGPGTANAFREDSMSTSATAVGKLPRNTVQHPIANNEEIPLMDKDSETYSDFSDLDPVAHPLGTKFEYGAGKQDDEQFDIQEQVISIARSDQARTSFLPGNGVTKSRVAHVEGQASEPPTRTSSAHVCIASTEFLRSGSASRSTQEDKESANQPLDVNQPGGSPECPGNQRSNIKATKFLEYLISPTLRNTNEIVPSLAEVLSAYQEQSNVAIGKDKLAAVPDIESMTQAEMLQLAGQLAADHVTNTFGNQEDSLVVTRRRAHLEVERQHQRFDDSKLIRFDSKSTTVSENSPFSLLSEDEFQRHPKNSDSLANWEVTKPKRYNQTKADILDPTRQRQLHLSSARPVRQEVSPARRGERNSHTNVASISNSMRTTREANNIVSRDTEAGVRQDPSLLPSLSEANNTHPAIYSSACIQSPEPEANPTRSSFSPAKAYSPSLWNKLYHMRHLLLTTRPVRPFLPFIVTVLYWTTLAFLFISVHRERREWYGANFFDNHSEPNYARVRGRVRATRDGWEWLGWDIVRFQTEDWLGEAGRLGY